MIHTHCDPPTELSWRRSHPKIKVENAVFILLLFCGASQLRASTTTRYVDNSGSPPCSNTPAYGSEFQPWCTINYAVSQIPGGDTLYVKAGTYNENVLINRSSGTTSNPTILQAFPGHTVTLYGNGMNTGRVKIAGVSYVTLDGFIITNFNQGLFVDNSDHITVQNCHVHHVGQQAVTIHFNSSFVTFQNNTVNDTRQWQYNGEGIYIGSGSNGPLDNTHNVVVRNNTIYNTTDEAIELKPGTHDCLVEDNLIYNATTAPTWPSQWGAIEINEATLGAQSWGSDPNHLVRNNIIHDSKTAIRAGTGSTIYNNLIYNVSSSNYGIYINNGAGDGYTRRIYHNTVDLPGSHAIVVNAGATDIRNNIGPAAAYNIATSDSYYVNKTGGNYHLTSGNAAVDSGLDLTAMVSTDIDGNSRLTASPPDLGAYEYAGDSSPSDAPPTDPTGLRIP